MISFQDVLHFGVGRSQIELNMKVKIEISIFTGLMLNDHSNPYIESILPYFLIIATLYNYALTDIIVPQWILKIQKKILTL